MLSEKFKTFRKLLCMKLAKLINKQNNSTEQVFETPILFEGKQFEFKFVEAGMYQYKCIMRPGIKGTISVQETQPTKKPKKLKPTPIKNPQFSKIRPAYSQSGSQNTNDSFSITSSSCYSFIDNGNAQKLNEEQIEIEIQNEFLRVQQECLQDRIQYKSIFDEEEDKKQASPISKNKDKYQALKSVQYKNIAKEKNEYINPQSLSNTRIVKQTQLQFQEQNQEKQWKELGSPQQQIGIEKFQTTNDFQEIKDVEFQFYMEQIQNISDKIENCFKNIQDPETSVAIQQELSYVKNRPEFININEQIEKKENQLKQHKETIPKNQSNQKTIQKKISQIEKEVEQLQIQKLNLIKQLKQEEENKLSKKKKKRNKPSKGKKNKKPTKNENVFQFEQLFEQEYKDNNFQGNEIEQMMLESNFQFQDGGSIATLITYTDIELDFVYILKWLSYI